MISSFDPISKRIFSIALSISIVLLAASLFIFSIKQASAKSSDSTNRISNYQNCYWSHVENGKAYFMDSKGALYYRPLDGAYRQY